MRARDWLYFGLVTAGLGFLTLLLSAGFFFALHGIVNPDFDFFLITLAPFLVSLPIAYAVFSLRLHSPKQRKLLAGFLLSFLGIIMLLSGIGAYYESSFGVWNPFDPIVEILIGLLGFPVMIAGFSLAGPIARYKGAKADEPTQVKQLPPGETGQSSSYLPTAGVAMLLATMLTFLIMFLSVPTALSSCYGSDLCPPPAMVTIGVTSTIGFVTGIISASSLLKGQYQRHVPLGVTFQALAAVLTIVIWMYWFLIALPIVALCVVSGAIIGWNQRESMGRREWRLIGLVSGSLGASGLVAALSLFAYQPCNACLKVCSRPYATHAGLLATLGASGIALALISVDSLRTNGGRPPEFPLTRPRQVDRSKFSHVMVLLLGVNLALATGFSMMLVAPFFTQCRGFCPTTIEQVNITQVTFGPAANQVIFTLDNSGTSYVTISQVQVQGGGIINPSYATQLSASVICSGGTMTLVATFQGVNFVPGTTYAFTLISIQGNKFPYAATR